jgi:sugar/nucleoside kinase (ribokinase family)
MQPAPRKIDYAGCGKICLDARIPQESLRRIVRSFDEQPGQVVLIGREDVPKPAAGGLGNKVPIMQQLGFSSAVAGILGDDIYGHGLAKEFKKMGVDTALLRFMPGETTEFSLIENTETDRNIAHYSGLTGYFALGRKEMRFLEKNKPYFVDVIYALLLPGFDGKPMKEAFHRLRQSGIMTTTSVLTNDKLPYRDMLNVLEEVDLFLVNEKEGLYMTGEKEPLRIVKKLSEHTDGIVGVTLGKEGSLLRYNGKNHEGRTLRQDKPPDFTGAGDAFSVGVQAGIIHDLKCGQSIDIRKAAGIGHMVAEDYIFHTGIRPISHYLQNAVM